MHVLYLDESGIHGDARYFVLAGLAIFEREAYWYADDLELIQRRYLPEAQESHEFHISALRAPEGSVPPPFDSLDIGQRRRLLDEVYQVIGNRRGVLFGVAIEKDWFHGDPYERAFEDLTSRFDLFLSRINSQRESSEEHRGIIVVAESTYQRKLEVLGQKFRGGSTRWRQVRNLADVPFFVPARNTRLLQLADFCANAIYGRYNSGYTRHFDVISKRFDREGNRIHGLVHLTRNRDCQCMACLTRSLAAGT